MHAFAALSCFYNLKNKHCNDSETGRARVGCDMKIGSCECVRVNVWSHCIISLAASTHHLCVQMSAHPFFQTKNIAHAVVLVQHQCGVTQNVARLCTLPHAHTFNGTCCVGMQQNIPNPFLRLPYHMFALLSSLGIDAQKNLNHAWDVILALDDERSGRTKYLHKTASHGC